MTLKEKMELYKSLDAKAEGIRLELENAIKEKSEAVKAIAEEIAPKKKILADGVELTIVVRGDTYFFRGENKKKENNIVEI